MEPLKVNNLTVKHDTHVAVENVSIVLRAGEINAIIGPNGAGKSTLLQSLNGLLKPSAGEIFVNGESIDHLSRRTIAKQIAVVAQEAELRFPVSVLEFVLGGRFVWASNTGWGWETQRDLEIATDVLKETELTHLSGRLMSQLSGGERQRAVLARALATEAFILLLDEPTANLDLSHQSALLALVRERCDSQGAASLVVTHDINLAAQFADHVLLMKSARVIKSGKPAEVLTPEILKEVFEVEVLVDAHPISGAPRVTPVHQMHRPV